MFLTVYIAFVGGMSVAVFTEKNDCIEFCVAKGAEMMTINREDIHEYI
jgi:hypothetical protein